MSNEPRYVKVTVIVEDGPDTTTWTYPKAKDVLVEIESTPVSSGPGEPHIPATQLDVKMGFKADFDKASNHVCHVTTTTIVAETNR